MIDERIEALNDWRGRTLSQIRALIKQADPEKALKALIRAAVKLNAST